MGSVNTDLRMYRDALSQKMRKSQWYQIPVWGEMIGHIGGVDEHGYPRSVPFGATQAKTLRPTGKVIEVLTDFNHQGGVSVDVPIKLPYTQPPVYGDVQAEGTEEDMTWVYNRCLINQVRKAVKTSDGLAGEQAFTPKKIMQIWGNAKEELVEYNQKWQAYAPYDAMYRGYSENILAAKSDGGYGDVLVQRSHPNFYVAGFGRVERTAGMTDAQYETAVAAQLDLLGATDTLTWQAIRNMQIYGSRLKIVPTKVGPRLVKGILIINDAQMAQLSADTTFHALHKELISKAGENAPLFSGAYEEWLVEGVLILVDVNNPGVWTSSDSLYSAARGTINYGNANPIANPIHETDRKLAIFMGASAILCGHTVPLGFKNRTADYDNIKGEASYTVVGYSRADRYDHDSFLGSARFIENSSSAVLATYSPNNPSWGS